MNQIEYIIHCAIIEHLDSAWPQIERTHAGKARDKAHAHFLSKMGYDAGTGDIIWFCQYMFGEMEVKRFGGVQSSEQKRREAKLIRNGGRYVIVKSVRESHEYWKSLGLTPMHNAIREPDLRTDEQKKGDAMKVYMP